MRLIDADAVKEALRNRICENIDECINNVPTIDVLDKISAEIADKYMTATGEVNTVAKGCLQIIDKYKAESEDK